MHQFGLFDLKDRYEQLSRAGDPLEQLNAVVDWKIFTPLLEKAFFRARKSEAGRKPYNRLSILPCWFKTPTFRSEGAPAANEVMQLYRCGFGRGSFPSQILVSPQGFLR